jgi:hypothetical protein
MSLRFQALRITYRCAYGYQLIPLNGAKSNILWGIRWGQLTETMRSGHRLSTKEKTVSKETFLEWTTGTEDRSHKSLTLNTVCLRIILAILKLANWIILNNV